MTLSDDSLHAKQTHNVTRQEPHYNPAAGSRAQASQGVSLKGRVQSQELLSVDSHVTEDLRKSLARPVACVLVLGGKTRTQADMGRTIDMWRCDIDPGRYLGRESQAYFHKTASPILSSVIYGLTISYRYNIYLTELPGELIILRCFGCLL